MKDVYWLVPGLLAGRPGPRLVPWDLGALWAGGFRVILSLNDEVDQAAIAVAGFTHGKFYFPPVLLLTPIESQAFLRLMDRATQFIHDQLVAARPTLVHCHAGKDRTGAVVAGYLIRYQGLSPGEATRLVRQANPTAMTAPGFDRMPRLFSQKLEGWPQRQTTQAHR
jgi:hypothetical protein